MCMTYVYNGHTYMHIFQYQAICLRRCVLTTSDPCAHYCWPMCAHCCWPMSTKADPMSNEILRKANRRHMILRCFLLPSPTTNCGCDGAGLVGYFPAVSLSNCIASTRTRFIVPSVRISSAAAIDCTRTEKSVAARAEEFSEPSMQCRPPCPSRLGGN